MDKPVKRERHAQKEREKERELERLDSDISASKDAIA